MDSRLTEVKKVTGGMLPLEVYQRLFEIGAASRGLFVEVGTAHGAATIAMALGAQSAGSDFRIVTVDPFGGEISSRTAYGSPEQNVRIVERYFEQFGVRDRITIVRGGVEDVIRTQDITDISVLLIDADGRIDRDLAALYPRVAPGAVIVLDDIDPRVCITRSNGRTFLNQKHRIGGILAERFERVGLLEKTAQINATGFFRKLNGDPELILAEAIPAYRELVFARMDELPAFKPSLRALLSDTFPQGASMYRMLRTRLRRA